MTGALEGAPGGSGQPDDDGDCGDAYDIDGGRQLLA